jgi:FMN hydrolase / 5-amino-6-(5-phospho-D-ribitylamino)uracil phosphatase
MHTVKAISLDLDDTLWPIWPVIERAEAALHAFLQIHAPATAAQFPVPAMRYLREQIAQAHPELAHDFSAQRKLSLQHALLLSGESEALIEPAFAAFFQARNAVTLYPDCLPALTSLAAHFPLIAVTNGNADLEQTGIGHHFIDCISARNIGSAKPHAPIFAAASQALGIAPQHILHVGDDPWLDVQGAQNAGFQSVWINRSNALWPSDMPPPQLTLTNLQQLADRLERTFS